MKYELTLIESLVRYDLWSNNFVAPEEWVRVSAVSFREEVNRIKNQWRNKVFSATDERSIELYIQSHQKALIELTNVALEKLGADANIIYADTPADFRLTMYRIMYKGLEEMLEFIEKHFTRYFSQDICIPDSYKWIALRDFKEAVPRLHRKLKARNCDRRLLVLTTYPLIKFIEHSDSIDITYKRLLFLKELVKQLHELCKTKVMGRKLNHDLRMLLLYLDYNAQRCLIYGTDLIGTYVRRARSLDAQINRLAFVQKFIEQAQVKPGFSYSTQYASMKEQLLGWIASELYYIERENRARPKDSDSDPESSFRIKTNFSVPQLAYFVRVMVDIDLIRTKNIQELTRFVTRSVSTRKTDTISEESFRTKFYVVEDSTKSAVKDIVIGMLNQIRKG